MLPNYINNSIVEELSGNGKVICRFYNDTGGSLTRGTPRVISPKFVSGKGVILAVTQAATETTESNVVGIVVGDLAGNTTVTDAEYGLIQVMGPFGSNAEDYGATTSGTVAANDQLEILNGTDALIDAGADGGAVLEAESVAIAIEEVDTNVWAVYLLGKPSQIKAS